MNDETPVWWFDRDAVHGDLHVSWWRAVGGGVWSSGTEVGSSEYIRRCYAEGQRRLFARRTITGSGGK